MFKQVSNLYILLIIGMQSSGSLHDQLMQIIHGFDDHSTKIIKHVLRERFKKHFPTFMNHILSLNTLKQLLEVLEEKTPYLNLFNVIQLIEQVMKASDSKNINKLVQIKNWLFNMKKEEVLSFMTMCETEKEDFKKIEIQMKHSFDFNTYGEFFNHTLPLFSVMKLQDVVGFVRYENTKKLITYLIPSVYTEEACISEPDFHIKYMKIDRKIFAFDEPPLKNFPTFPLSKFKFILVCTCNT